LGEVTFVRILQINTVCKSGSTGKISYDIHTWLRDAGHESKIAYGRGAVIDDPDTIRIATRCEVYIHVALTRLTGWTGCFSPFATRKLFRLISEYKPDIVHLHNIHGYYVNDIALLSFLKKTKIRTIITMHDEWLYTGKCGYAYECGKWQTECSKCLQVEEYPASLFFDQAKYMLIRKKRVFEGFNNLTLVTPSKWLADRAKQSFLGDKRVVVIPNGIDTEIFKPIDTSKLKEKYGEGKTIVHVTPNFKDKRKGGQYVLELAKRMSDVRFFIVGNREPIVDAPKNVRAVGRTENQTQLAQWYSFADVTLLTSQSETFSLVCAESLACGTPVAGFDAGAPMEVAPEGYGKFVRYGDVDLLESVARGFLSGEIEFASKEMCVEFGQERYDKRRMSKSYFEIYKEMLTL